MIIVKPLYKTDRTFNKINTPDRFALGDFVVKTTCIGVNMGAHRKQNDEINIIGSKKPKSINIPKWPYNIGKRRKIKTIWGTERHLIIEDEIMHQQINAAHKLIAFQKIRLEEEERIEFRFGYYMIGVKPGAKGRWVWGQFALLIPEDDLKVILKEAKKKKWF